jgi:hypothetical protein
MKIKFGNKDSRWLLKKSRSCYYDLKNAWEADLSTYRLLRVPELHGTLISLKKILHGSEKISPRRIPDGSEKLQSNPATT